MDDKDIKKQSSNLVSGVGNYLKIIIKRLQGLFQPKKKLFAASWQDVKLEISPDVNRYLEMRHVLEDEVKQVIYHAETTGEKLYQPDSNRFLGKLKIGKVTYYADYAYGRGSYIVKYGYAHRSEIVG